MMTKLGKGLVYFIFVVAIGLAAFAWGILGNQFNWAGAPASPSEPGSLHDQNAKQIEDQQKDLVRLRARWKGEGEALATLEARRQGQKDFYADHLNGLRTGKGVKGKDIDGGAVRSLTYHADGRLNIDNTGKPVMGPNTDERLKPRDTLDEELAKLDKELNETIVAINDLIAEQKKFTLMLRGDPGKAKGLLALLEDAERDRRNAEAELENARQEAINGRVSVQTLIKRQKQLQARVKELREFNLAQTQP